MSNMTNSINAAYASLVEVSQRSPTQIDFDDITFHATLKESDMSVIYLISSHGENYVMKLFHIYPGDLKDDEILFRNELMAYQRLSACGLSDKGMICRLFGSVTNIDPAINETWLNPFINDAFRPCAVFLEYIPDLREINSDTYTKQRWIRATEIQNEILRAGVLHDDIYNNAMFSVNMISEERVVWLDFDRAQTFDRDIRETPSAIFQIDQIRKLGLDLEKAHEEGVPSW
ncbi:hypothetical protein BDV59DRAFT_203902 [Aspergillus ambiguus]|uniref:uncharacterized protein n=1 Tax=Aspergillus ambiguus TaxID=176160 RepID=UPI003CCCAE15